jgi:RNA polymerase sigma-B factor
MVSDCLDEVGRAPAPAPDSRAQLSIPQLEAFEAVGHEALRLAEKEELGQVIGEEGGAIGAAELELMGDLAEIAISIVQQLVHGGQGMLEDFRLVARPDLELELACMVYPAVHGPLMGAPPHHDPHYTSTAASLRGKASRSSASPGAVSSTVQSPDKRALDDRRLLTSYQESGDPKAREELVKRFLPLARQLARRYQRTNEPLDDLMQVASVGLVKAIDRFDPERGTAFSTFAVPTILGELKRYFRDSGWAAHVPRGMQERAMKLDQAVEALHRRLNRSPSTKEVAAELDLTEEEVLEAIEAQSAYDAVSLEQHRSDDSEAGDTYADMLGDEEQRYELVEYEATIAPALKALSARDRLILHLRFSEDLTQSEIAERIGVSQMHVSRLIRRALGRLRAVAKSSEPDA